jgi:sugar O-acyltransferase (sialic acid O-acetyltransferase NeuD family)
MNLPVIILGAGGHAKVLIEALRTSNVSIAGITDADVARLNSSVMGVPVLGNDSMIDRHRPDSILLVNGVGSVNLPRVRTALFERFKGRGFSFAIVRHASAVIASDTVLGEGAQVMAGAVIQPGCRIGMDTIVNTNATIDHDCEIGNHAHVAPGVTLSGGVRVGVGTHVGTGATVIQGIVIGKNCLVAAGAVVTTNVRDDTTVVGVPAREVHS